MRKPPSEHDEWLEENQEPEKPLDVSPKKPLKHPLPNKPSRASSRLKALNDDIQEFG